MPKKLSVKKVKSISTRKRASLMEVLPEFGSNVVPRKRGSKKNIVTGMTLAIVLLLLSGFYYTYKAHGQKLESERFRAIVMSDGQIYFGRILEDTKKDLILTDVFYFDYASTLAVSSANFNNEAEGIPILIKKGEEYYRPDATIRLNRNKVISIEDLEANSRLLNDIHRRL